MTSPTRALALALTLLAAPLAARAEMLKPADPFPAWSLVDSSGATVSSKDLAGKTYLLWYYPKAGTPGCTAEGRALRDRAKSFADETVEIVGVSFDTPLENAAFVANEGFPYRLVSDGDRKLAVAVGAADTPSQPHARRISYLVGGDGKVLRAYANVNPATHAADVLADLAKPSP